MEQENRDGGKLNSGAAVSDSARCGAAENIGAPKGSRAAKCLTILAAAIFLAAAAASIFVLRPSKERLVEVVQDDEVLYTIDLESAEDMTFTVTYPREDSAGTAGGSGAATQDGSDRTAPAPAGSSNTITVQDGEIWVSAAECPDHTCMKMGKLRSKRLPIVCLPNRLVIRFAE